MVRHLKQLTYTELVVRSLVITFLTTKEKKVPSESMQYDDVLSHESIPIVHSFISTKQGKEAPNAYTLSTA